ncbi:MAG: hypothetical protein IPG84_17240 [Betaproteobacteria bacterium]|nr:hypothetical protein [Betaproteobacteria bacterium]
MRAARDQVDAVVRLDLEAELAPVDADELRARGHDEPRRRRGLVAHVDVRAHRLLGRPVEVRLDDEQARPLEEADEEAGREHRGHRLEVGRLGVERRHRLRRRDDEAQLVLETGLERFLHGDLRGAMREG